MWPASTQRDVDALGDLVLRRRTGCAGASAAWRRRRPPCRAARPGPAPRWVRRRGAAPPGPGRRGSRRPRPPARRPPRRPARRGPRAPPRRSGSRRSRRDARLANSSWSRAESSSTRRASSARRGGAPDRAPEPLVDQQRQQAAVVEVRVGEHHGIERRRVHAQRHPVAHRLVRPALEHAAVHEHPGPSRVHEMAGAGHGPGAAEEGELHVRIVTQVPSAGCPLPHRGGRPPSSSPASPASSWGSCCSAWGSR